MKIFKKESTVVPDKNVGAEKIVTKDKFNGKSFCKNLLINGKKGILKLGDLIKKGYSKVSELAKSHKKISIGVACFVVVLVGVLFIFPSLSKPSTEDIVKNKISELGKTFYEDFYYPSSGNGDANKRKEFLAKYQSMGIKVNLENLIRYYVTTDSFKEAFPTVNDKEVKDVSITDRVQFIENEWFKVGKEENDKCDVNNTKVIIYPKDPYEKNTYEMEIVTACGFKGEESSSSTTKNSSDESKKNATQKTTEQSKATTKKTKKK